MTVALVGSQGAINTTATTTNTPAFGQATTAGHLLVARAGSNGTAAPATTASGWTRVVTGGASGNFVAIFYKPNCGAGETAPQFTSTGASAFCADLTEWSGASTGALSSAVVDQSNSQGVGSTVTNAAADYTPIDLVVGCTFLVNSKSATYTVSNSWTTAGTKTADHSTGATKQAFCFDSTALIANQTPGVLAADQYSWTITPSTGTPSSNPSAIVSFLPFVVPIVGTPTLQFAQAVDRAATY